MLFKKLLRTMGSYKAQFISMIVMIALGIGIFVGFNMEWVSIDRNIGDFFDETGYADYQIISEKGFSSDELEKISSLGAVKAAARYVSVSADVKERDGDSVTLAVTTNAEVSAFTVVDGGKYDKNSSDGIWLSDKYASENKIDIGDTLTLVYKNIEIKGKVIGLIKSGEKLVCVRDETQLMPDYKTYGFAYISPKAYENAVGTDYYPQINVLSDKDKKDFTDLADKALGKTVLIVSKSESSSYSAANGEIEEGKTMGSVMPVLFLLIAVLTMVTTMHRITAKEKTQIGTLKALGFKNSRILIHYTSYAFIIAIAGSAIGTALGYGIAWYIMNPNGMMGTYFDMPHWKLYLPNFCIIILLAIIIALTFIGFLSVKEMLKGTAADALRPYTPKKIKPMLIERTKLFHKLPFGTRWNMRDIVRHKSRTAMSLIGTVGCMILVVGSLGMRDTMDAFLDMYYDRGLNYSSRIYISEDADLEQRNAVAEKYNGDCSASIGVQLEDKTVELDIYKLKNDYVRFFDDKNADEVTLSDKGAYVCMRIADQFDIKKDDTITVSPYGTDDEYKLKIAGVLRSVSESIIMTDKYADNAGVSYSFDSVYTTAEKSDIAADSAVKSVQTKQMIIDSFDTFTELMDSMIFLLVCGALLLGIVVLYNLGVMSYTERYREMATLKVVGFKDKKIGALLAGQNLWVSAIGIIIGLPCGAATLDYLLKALAGEYEMKMVIGPLTYCISILLTLGMSLLVSALVSRKNKKIDMVEALKGSE